ncbi:MAG: site-2 protease family protein [[Eubacterium] saphenum]|nr:site-2 protease family protein [[Eubacterium] saphenum]
MRGPLFYLIDFFTGRQPIEMFIYSLFGVLAFLFICIPVHECAHAFVAKRLGDDTAERQGRLTLNPFAHIDLMGVVMMFVCSIGWAKPTPVDLRRCNKVKVRTANLLVSAAGPLSNLIMAFLFTIICKLLLVLSIKNANITLYQIAQIVLYIANLNAFLAVFNLIPVPPFDGYHILASFLPAKALVFFERNAQIINLVLIILLVSGYASIPIGWLSDKIMEFFFFATSFIK